MREEESVKHYKIIYDCEQSELGSSSIYGFCKEDTEGLYPGGLVPVSGITTGYIF